MKKPQKKSRRNRTSRTRPFRMEHLEDRKMMAVTVTTTADVTANDGLTSLREAVVITNGSPLNRIDFDSSLSGSNFRLNSQLFVTDTLTIDASALSENVVINAQNNSRALDFTASNGNLTLKAVTVKNGEIADVGGGIRFSSSGDLTLYDSSIINNQTTGSNNHGGGIYSQAGNITLIRSTVSGNSTTGDDANGGGIGTLLGDVTLTRSTVSENYTTGNDSDGGGVQTTVGTITANQSTISSNYVNGTGSQGGGIHTDAGEIVVEHSTVIANTMRNRDLSGAGISMDPDNTSLIETLTLHSSIVAGNTAGGLMSDFLAPDGATNALTVTYSLIGDNLGTTLAEAHTADADGNLIGSTIYPIDPRSGPLGDYGGATATHRLLWGSPALNAGPQVLTNPASFDQRGVGFPRVIADRIDIGAYERDQIVVNDNSSDSDDGDPDNGITTLREAVNIANTRDDEPLVTFAPSLSGQTISILGALEVEETLSVDATALDSNVIIDAQGFSEVFRGNQVVGADPSLTVAGLTLTGGQTAGNGGAISFDSLGTLTVADSTITGNLAAVNGGGIHSEGNLEIFRSTISNNTSYGGGGGISTYNDNLLVVTVADTTISGNTAGLNGGGLFLDGATGDISSSTISGNHAGGDGGGVYCNSFTDLLFSTVTQNTAGGRGGGFYRDGYGGVMAGSIVSGNLANSVPDNLYGFFLGDGGTILLGDGDYVSSSQLIWTNDPMLGPLADNGGPTLTHALLPGSPAIDSATRGGLDFPEFDQRHEPRVFGSDIDIGSFELQATIIDPDFNDDGNIDGVDIDLLQANLVGGPADPATFDLTGDGQVTIADRDEWLVQAGAANLPSGNPYLLGDATLDGVVDGQDFVLWNNNKFMSSSDWTSGDFNSDGIVDGQDFVLWNNHKFMSADASISGPTDWWSSCDVTGEDEDSQSYERQVDDLFAAFV